MLYEVITDAQRWLPNGSSRQMAPWNGYRCGGLEPTHSTRCQRGWVRLCLCYGGHTRPGAHSLYRQWQSGWGSVQRPDFCRLRQKFPRRTYRSRKSGAYHHEMASRAQWLYCKRRAAHRVYERWRQCQMERCGFGFSLFGQSTIVCKNTQGQTILLILCPEPASRASYAKPSYNFV